MDSAAPAREAHRGPRSPPGSLQRRCTRPGNPATSSRGSPRRSTAGTGNGPGRAPRPVAESESGDDAELTPRGRRYDRIQTKRTPDEGFKRDGSARELRDGRHPPAEPRVTSTPADVAGSMPAWAPLGSGAPTRVLGRAPGRGGSDDGVRISPEGARSAAEARTRRRQTSSSSKQDDCENGCHDRQCPVRNPQSKNPNRLASAQREKSSPGIRDVRKWVFGDCGCLDANSDRYSDQNYPNHHMNESCVQCVFLSVAALRIARHREAPSPEALDTWRSDRSEWNYLAAGRVREDTSTESCLSTVLKPFATNEIYKTPWSALQHLPIRLAHLFQLRQSGKHCFWC